MEVQVQNLTKKYGTHKAVNEISFNLKKGEIVGFLGVNGAGKSTTMKMLTGALLPTSGNIFIQGQNIATHPIQAQQKIGYLPEHNPLYLEMYVREYLGFRADIFQIDKSRIEQMISLTGLSSHANKKIVELSKGYRQRVGLAAALLHDPEILILDEPTTGLDPNQILEIRQIIRELASEKVILLSSHIMQEIQAICHRVMILHQGKIILDKPMNELQNKHQTIEVQFDYKIEEQFLKKIPHLTSVQNLYDSFYVLSFDNQEDMRASVFDFATENGLKILQINHKHNDLETLFTELTKP